MPWPSPATTPPTHPKSGAAGLTSTATSPTDGPAHNRGVSAPSPGLHPARRERPEVHAAPAHGPLLAGFLTGGLVAPAWCTSWRNDATTIVGPLLGLPEFPYLDLPRPEITTSHPNGYLWKRDHVEPWLGGSAVAWVDDDFTNLDHAWAAERTAKGTPTLLVQPEPHLGLQPEHLTEVITWVSQLPRARVA
ncbi:hypothetical protein ACIPW5_14580 [Streptomyces sp. NPDC090077]|uniref:hypothetical protein n=1 Tax=Streptomyces sp. NPDC090077 TaxID=3365938 RepID=UPI003814CE9E